jgi:hypothetical protein
MSVLSCGWTHTVLVSCKCARCGAAGIRASQAHARRGCPTARQPAHYPTPLLTRRNRQARGREERARGFLRLGCRCIGPAGRGDGWQRGAAATRGGFRGGRAPRLTSARRPRQSSCVSIWVKRRTCRHRSRWAPATREASPCPRRTVAPTRDRPHQGGAGQRESLHDRVHAQRTSGAQASPRIGRVPQRRALHHADCVRVRLRHRRRQRYRAPVLPAERARAQCAERRRPSQTRRTSTHGASASLATWATAAGRTAASPFCSTFSRRPACTRRCSAWRAGRDTA